MELFGAGREGQCCLWLSGSRPYKEASRNPGAVGVQGLGLRIPRGSPRRLGANGTAWLARSAAVFQLLSRWFLMILAA